jgi:hypothetical protein
VKERDMDEYKRGDEERKQERKMVKERREI